MLTSCRCVQCMQCRGSFSANSGLHARAIRSCRLFPLPLQQLAAPGRLAPCCVVRRFKDVADQVDADVSAAEAGDEIEAVLLCIGHKAGVAHSFFSSTPNVYRCVLENHRWC